MFIYNRRDKVNKRTKRRLIASYKNYDDFFQDLNSVLEKNE